MKGAISNMEAQSNAREGLVLDNPRKLTTEQLVNKYLSGKTTREEERNLLDICLRDINKLMVELPGRLKMINAVIKSAS